MNPTTTHTVLTSGLRRLASLMLVSIGLSALTPLGGCASAPETFPTPEAAVDALVAAMRSNSGSEMERVLGSDSKDLISSGDAVADANGRAKFLEVFNEKHTLTPDGDDSMTLVVGNNDWPLPIPIVKNDKGWYFDTAAGLDEVLSRRIGRNELATIQVCLAIADAQRDYASADFDGNGWREYASRFFSSPGKKDGLYWPAAAGAPDSPLGELAAAASAEGYKRDANAGPQPYHGYYYRILTKQGPDAMGGSLDYIVQGHMIGGFAVVAWPADYGNSGLKTFIINHQGVVYERDLGDDTPRLAKDMQAFNPGPGWSAVASEAQ